MSFLTGVGVGLGITSLLGGRVRQNPINTQMQQRLNQLEAQLVQRNNELQQAFEEAKKLSDPKHYARKKDEIFQVFLNNLKSFNFEDVLEDNGMIKFIVIGPTSAGKTSILNYVFGTNFKTGVGKTTDKVEFIAKSQNIQIYDSPGQNQAFQFFDIYKIKLFWSMKRIFILYRDTVQSVNHIVRILGAINKRDIYLVRTQVDNFSTFDWKTLEQELETDKKYVEERLGFKIPILAISARKGPEFANNAQFIALVKGQR